MNRGHEHHVLTKPIARTIFIGLLVLYSCNSNTKESTLAMNMAISLYVTEGEKQVLPHEIVIIPDTGFLFKEDTYKGTFGKQPVTLVKDSKGDLVFSVPDVSDGSYELIIPLQTVIGRADFTVSGRP